NIECSTTRGQNDTYHEAACVAVDESLRVQIEGMYAHNGAVPDPAAGSYWVSIAIDSSEVLVENSIMLNETKLIVGLQAGGGNVVANNFMDDPEECKMDEAWVDPGAGLTHCAGTHDTLLEGNLTEGLGEDDTNGNVIYETFFRNWSQGYRTPAFVNAYTGHTINDLTNSPGGNGPFMPVSTATYGYWDSFVGNVLGLSGYSTAANDWSYSGGGSKHILSLGWNSDAAYINPKAGFDTNGQGGTTIAHGNYDYLQNTVTWDTNYANHALPNSFYVTSAPAFFKGTSCTYPWPWVTPTAGSPIQNASGGTGCSS